MMAGPSERAGAMASPSERDVTDMEEMLSERQNAVERVIQLRLGEPMPWERARMLKHVLPHWHRRTLHSLKLHAPS